MEEFYNTIPKPAEAWAKKLANQLNLRVCGIDVFSQNHLENPEEFTVIEVNGQPSLRSVFNNGREAECLEVWRRVLGAYFS